MSVWLLRQDAAAQALPRWLSISAALALTTMGLVVNVGLFMSAKQGAELPDSVIVASLALVIWMTMAAFLLTGAFRQRCNDLTITLPLTVKRLWLTHFTAVTLFGLVVSSVVTGIGAVALWLVGRATEHPPLMAQASMLQLGAGAFVTFVLAVAVLQTRALYASSMPRNGSFVRLAAAVLGVGWGLTTLLATRPAALLLVPTVATALLVTWAVRKLPPAFAERALVDARADSRAPGVDSDATGRDAAVRVGWDEQGTDRYSALRLSGFFLLAAYRCGPKTFATIAFGIPGLLFFGFLMAGAIDVFDEDGSPYRWISIPLTVYMLLAIFAKPLKGLLFVDAFPVSRRVLFSLLVFPSLFLLAAGYAAGRAVVYRFAQQANVDFHRVTSSCSGITVPHSLLRIAWDGEVELIETPQGESYEPWRVPLYRGARAVLWSPYCSSDTSLAEPFVALQTSRAAADLYGVNIPPSEIERRFLSGATEDSGLPLRQEYPDLRAQARHASLPLLVVFLCCGWFLVVALYMRTYRSGISDRMRKWMFGGLLGFLMAIHVAQFAPFISEFTEPWILDAFWESGMRALAVAIPGGTATLWILGVTLCAFFYRIAERQFARAEFLGTGPVVC